MFKNVQETAVDDERRLSINFAVAGNRQSQEPEPRVGFYDHKGTNVRFYFDTLMFFRGPRMKHPSKFVGTIGYAFLDQILAKYKKAQEENELVTDVEENIEASLVADLTSAFETVYSPIFENQMPLYKLFFLSSSGIVFESRPAGADIIKSSDGPDLQFNRINVTPVQKLFEKAWAELTDGVE